MAPSPRSRSAERLVEIIIALHRNGSVNRRDLMQKFGITERTVYRDLQALSPIIEHDGKGRYRCCPRISPAAAYTTLKRTTKVHRARLFSVISITYFLHRGEP